MEDGGVGLECFVGGRIVREDDVGRSAAEVAGVFE